MLPQPLRSQVTDSVVEQPIDGPLFDHVLQTLVVLRGDIVGELYALFELQVIVEETVHRPIASLHLSLHYPVSS